MGSKRLFCQLVTDFAVGIEQEPVSSCHTGSRPLGFAAESLNMAKTQQAATASSRIWGMVFILGLFCVGVAGAWLWVWLGRTPQAEILQFNGRTQWSGYRFTAHTNDPAAIIKLATTNVLDGEFIGTSNFIGRVYLASWSAEEGRNISLVEHTPDICWPSVGWTPRDLGQPQQVVIPLGSTNLPFECRVFQAAGGHQEMVVWCSLLGGSVMPELELLKMNAKDSGEQSHASRSVSVRRRLKITQFLETITHRLPTQGSRQLARYSVPITSTWQDSLQQITNTCQQWLELKVTKPKGQTS